MSKIDTSYPFSKTEYGSRFDVIPEFAGALDIETKSVKKNAWVLSIGGALVDVQSLKLVTQLNLLIDPNCPDQLSVNRDVDLYTVNWWAERVAGDPGKPTDAAHAITWSGKQTTRVALDKFKQWCYALPRKEGQIVLSSKGPDFDFPILETLMHDLDCGKFPVRFRAVDSVRTIERAMVILGMHVPTLTEVGACVPDGVLIMHTALHDAIYEAYITASYYKQLGEFRDRLALQP